MGEREARRHDSRKALSVQGESVKAREEIFVIDELGAVRVMCTDTGNTSTITSSAEETALLFQFLDRMRGVWERPE